MRDAINGEDVVLRGVSALDFLRLFVGYLNESEIDVYAKSEGSYENVRYTLVDSFESIEYINDNGVLCSTASQAVNDILSDFDNADEEALANALSNYYYANNKNFSGLYIKPENLVHFEYMKKWAMEYYNEG
jgi:hypothetical protein